MSFVLSRHTGRKVRCSSCEAGPDHNIKGHFISELSRKLMSPAVYNTRLQIKSLIRKIFSGYPTDLNKTKHFSYYHSISLPFSHFAQHCSTEKKTCFLQDYGLLRRYVYFGRHIKTFWRNLLSPSFGQRQTACFSKTMVPVYQTTQHHITIYHNLDIHCCWKTYSSSHFVFK